LLAGPIKPTAVLGKVVITYAVFAIAAATTAFADKRIDHKPLVTLQSPVVSTLPIAVPPVTTPPVSTPANEDAQTLTLSLLEANAHLAASGAAEHSQRLAELVSIARNRHDALAALIE